MEGIAGSGYAGGGIKCASSGEGEPRASPLGMLCPIDFSLTDVRI